MKLISIGLMKDVEEIKAKLQKDCIVLSQQGFRVVIDEVHKGNLTFLDCNIIEGELSFRSYELIKGLLKTYVAKILAEYILFQEEQNLIRGILTSQYNYLSEEEQQLIFEKIVKKVQDNQCEFHPYYTNVLDSLHDYLGNNHELIVEGFIHFRLKDYRDSLARIVELVAEDFMTELEYKEFVRILRYFVDVQKPKIDEVHVVLREGNAFAILDSLGKDINHYCFDNVDVNCQGEANKEDLLVTALITIAPYSIVMHCTCNEKNTIETIKNVFADRVVVCSGCDVCHTDYLEISSPK